MSSDKSNDKDKPDFEQQLAELESIVTCLEDGSLSLEVSMQQYERGVTIANQCQQSLQSATQRLEKLNTDNNKVESWHLATDDSSE